MNDEHNTPPPGQRRPTPADVKTKAQALVPGQQGHFSSSGEEAARAVSTSKRVARKKGSTLRDEDKVELAEIVKKDQLRKLPEGDRRARTVVNQPTPDIVRKSTRAAVLAARAATAARQDDRSHRQTTTADGGGPTHGAPDDAPTSTPHHPGDSHPADSHPADSHTHAPARPAVFRSGRGEVHVRAPQPRRARSGTLRTGTARASTPGSGTARSGTARSGTLRTGTARTGTARSGTLRTGTPAAAVAPIETPPSIDGRVGEEFIMPSERATRVGIGRPKEVDDYIARQQRRATDAAPISRPRRKAPPAAPQDDAVDPDATVPEGTFGAAKAKRAPAASRPAASRPAASPRAAHQAVPPHRAISANPDALASSPAVTNIHHHGSDRPVTVPEQAPVIPTNKSHWGVFVGVAAAAAAMFMGWRQCATPATPSASPAVATKNVVASQNAATTTKPVATDVAATPKTPGARPTAAASANMTATHAQANASASASAAVTTATAKHGGAAKLRPHVAKQAPKPRAPKPPAHKPQRFY